jgi:glycosyltransferase involved in cell wall biosynthesis
MARILVDPEIFRNGRCGMTRYYAALCDGLVALGHDVVVPLYLSGCDFKPGRFGLLWSMDGSRLRRLPAQMINRAADRAAKRQFYRDLRGGAYDVALLTSPVFEDDFLAHVGAMPWIMVVHDTMRCVLGPDGLFDPAGANADRLAYLARRAHRIICISEATRRDLCNLSGVAPDRTAVIHTGCLLETGAQSESPGLPERFLLFVGERSGRKNFRAMVAAIAPLLRRDRSLHLICTGGFSVWELDALKHLGIADKVMAVPAPDAILVGLYRRALALIYPSLYEGFGLPPLEAMSLGCPVITAANSAIPEIVGDAALYVDPLDPTAMLTAAETLVGDPSLRDRLRQAGLARAALFSRSRMMQSFSDEFRRVAGATGAEN